MAKRDDLVYKDECYKIIGLIFEVFNNLGYGYKEKIYQKAIAETFKQNKIDFKEQLRAKVVFKGKELGLYILDFLVFGKIVIELKQKTFFSKKDIEQIYAYLKVTNLKLGLLIHFTKEGIRYKRVVNLK
jgi:GxxExxY protein